VCDLWSCGVIAYMLLCGYLPFRGKTDQEVRQKITDTLVPFPASDWAHVSERGMNLVNGLLNKDEEHRLTAEQSLSHAWIRDGLSVEACEVPVEAQIVLNVEGFRSLNRFKRAALQVIASLLSEEQTRAPREAFVALDVNGDGLISLSDLQERFQTPKLWQEVEQGSSEARELLKVMDISEGTWRACTYTEFVAATFDRRTYCTKNVCFAAFNIFDINGDGKVSRKELSKGSILGDLSKAEVDELVRDLDENGDGEIDFKEFIDMMRDGEGFTETAWSGARKIKKTGIQKMNKSSKPSSPVAGKSVEHLAR